MPEPMDRAVTCSTISLVKSHFLARDRQHCCPRALMDDEQCTICIRYVAKYILRPDNASYQYKAASPSPGQRGHRPFSLLLKP